MVQGRAGVTGGPPVPRKRGNSGLVPHRKGETPDRNPPQGGLEKWLPTFRATGRPQNPAYKSSTGTRVGRRKGRPTFAFLGGLLVGGFHPIRHIPELTVNFVDLFKLLEGL